MRHGIDTSASTLRFGRFRGHAEFLEDVTSFLLLREYLKNGSVTDTNNQARRNVARAPQTKSYERRFFNAALSC